MLKTYFRLILCFCFSLFIFVNVEGQQPDHYNAQVSKIEVAVKCMPAGMHFDKKNLLDRLKTKQGCIFNQTDFDEDLKALATEFDKVEPELDFEGDCVKITLDLWVKPVIRKIIWQGNCKIDTSTLEEELAIHPGSIFEHHCFNQAFHKIKALYIKKGYFEAELDYKVCPISQTNQIDIMVSVKEGRAGKIKNICFNGLTKEEQTEILCGMITKEHCFFTSWMDESGKYNEEALEQDKLTIIQYLQNQGYADAKVNIEICNHKKEDAIDIKINVCKGEAYCFGEIEICGNTLFETSHLHSNICVQKGERYSPDKIREAVRSLQALYGSKGYIETVACHYSQLQHSNTYNVRFEIEEGEQFRVGLIKVFGNTVTNTRVILNESLLVPGEVFDSRKLKATECRLEMIGFFKCVNVYPVKSNLGDEVCGHFRDVHIEVVETTTGNIGLFFGYSTVDALFGGLELTENNFNYRGLFSLFSKGPSCLRGNGEYLQLRTSIGTRSTVYCIRWAQPYFMDTPWVVGFDAERSFNRAVSNDYDIDTVGFKIHGTYPINPFLRYTLYYRYQNSFVRLKNDDPPSVQLQEKKEGAISAVGHSLCYDSTDCPLKPSRGFRSSLTLECAGLGGQFNFISTSYINSYYYPVGRRGTLKFRLDMRFILPVHGTSPTDIPLAERFYLGGEDSVRGYRPYSIGSQFPNTGDPTGGISSFLASEEYMYNICNRVDAFVFVDAGSISLNRYQIGPIQASAGGGIRVEVMNNIPIIVGYGWPLNPQNRSQVKKFFISLGGRF